jgi:hypothetical protein
LAKRAAARLTVSELVAEASDFSRQAWRACWLPMALVTTGHTLQFLHGNMSADEWRPGLFGFLAYALMIFYLPLYGALYRTAIGGRPAAGRGPGGLQWGGVEWRLIAVGVVVAFLIGLSVMPFLAVMGILVLVLGAHRVVSVGPLGSFSYVGLASIPVWLLFFCLMAPRIGRLMLGWAYSTARAKTEPFGGWEPARRSGWPIAWALALAWIPLLLGYLTIYALTLIEGDALTPNAWPLPEALGAGVLLGAMRAAMVAPLMVGVVTGAYWLLTERDLEAHAAPPVEDAPAEPPPMVHGDADPPDEASLPPADDADGHDAAAAAAAALAAEQAAELDLPPSEVDHRLTEPTDAASPDSGDVPDQPLAEAAVLEHAEPSSAAAAELHRHADEVGSPVPEHAMVEPAASHQPPAPELQPPEHPEPQHEAAEHVATEHHSGLAQALEAAAAAAAIAGAAALAAHEAQKAHEADAARAHVAHDFQPETAVAPTPEPAHTSEIGPLSPWPHSVLPPWPVRGGAPKPEIVLAAASSSTRPAVDLRRDAASDAESKRPLAQPDEPAHRFVEFTELK